MDLEKTNQKRWLAILVIAFLALTILTPAGATLAKSGQGYHLVMVTGQAEKDVSTSAKYTLTQIGTQPASEGSRGERYHLLSLVPQKVQAEYCAYLPITLRNW